MSDFIWNTVIAYLILFVLLSFSLTFYIKDKSYLYYGLYNLFLMFYVLTKNNWFYETASSLFNINFESKSTLLILNYFNWYIQIIFYCLYFMFANYFLDFDKLKNTLFKLLRTILFWIFIASSILMIVCIINNKYNWFHFYFVYVYVPIMVGLFIYALPKAIKLSNKHKYFLITGVFLYVLFALVALIESTIAYNENNLETNAIQFFFFGIIAEGTFFSIGLAYKMKLINDERIISKNLVITEKHNREISTLKALIDGEEKERKRIAQDLHDGINGDLSSIKFQLSSLEINKLSQTNKNNINNALEMIDYTYNQVRNLSHNLSPTIINEFGLVESVKSYCTKLNQLHSLNLEFQFFGNNIVLNKNIETIIYRIIQELVNNIIKHSEATEALVQMNYHDNYLFITVEDNGTGFENKNDTGIGLKNIASRIEYLNASLDIIQNNYGSTFNINIDLENIPNHDYN